jgi:hypothetical protein
MKRKGKVSTGRLIKKREASLKKLAAVGPVVRGSLVTAGRGNHLAHQLTVSVKGKTHTVYVPIDMVKEVTEWIRNYRQMRRIITDISKLSMAIIHRHAPESQGGPRSRGKNSPKQ